MEFRDTPQYNNMMYMVLSYLHPIFSKMPFTRYVKQHIFDPLGMNSTTYSFDVANASGQLADGMTRQNGTVRAFPYWSKISGEDGNSKSLPVVPYLYANLSSLVLSGAGGIISNAVDMVKYSLGWTHFERIFTTCTGYLAPNTIARGHEARHKYFSNTVNCNTEGRYWNYCVF